MVPLLVPLSSMSFLIEIRQRILGNLLMPMVGHATQWKKILPMVGTISMSPWAVWTCIIIIKERNTRKYEYVIQLATIEITSACIL